MYVHNTLGRKYQLQRCTLEIGPCACRICGNTDVIILVESSSLVWALSLRFICSHRRALCQRVIKFALNIAASAAFRRHSNFSPFFSFSCVFFSAQSIHSFLDSQRRSLQFWLPSFLFLPCLHLPSLLLFARNGRPSDSFRSPVSLQFWHRHDEGLFHFFFLIDTVLTWFQRSIETVGGPDAKKARWSPTFAGQTNTSNSNNRDAFANYGYGPQASITQSAPFNNSPTSAVFGNNPLYTSTSLSINTQANGSGIPPQLSPNNIATFGQQQQQHGQQQQQSNQQQQSSPTGNGYSSFPTGYAAMHGMGLPGMNMLGNFSYNGQMVNFAQVILHGQ